jgi:hypothetical protein
MVEMKQLRACRASAVERVRPCADQPLVRLVVDRGEDLIGRARPILIRRLERHSARAALSARRIVDRDQIEAEEGRRMRLLSRPSERTGRQRHLPARLRQGAAECTRDLRRAAAWEEEQAHHDAAAARRAALTARRRSQPPPSGTIAVAPRHAHRRRHASARTERCRRPSGAREHETPSR